MIRKASLLLFIVAVFTGTSYCQKVKYKDLLVWLNAKQYDQAEPFLKKYLVENEDNPSAYLFMGIIYQEKSAKNDVLKQTDILYSNIDSAILFYDKCLPKLTEKDVKKNDENYIMYTRRDYRTGEFGIKLSDIQLDIETRTKALKERKERVKLLKKYYLEAEAQYTKSNSYYKRFQNQFSTKKEMYLQSNDEMILELNLLASTFDSSLVSFKNYKATSQLLGKTGYNQMVDLKEIKDFKKEGSSMIDFMLDDLKLWDYTEWAKKTVRNIRDEVYPARKDLIAFDGELNKLRESIKKDSSVVNIEELNSNPVFSELKKWDADPMPLAVFRMKIAELEYVSQLVTQSSLMNSEDISKKMSAIKRQQIALKILDSLATVLTNRDWEKETNNYKSFISGAYGTTSVLKNLSKSTHEFAKREFAAKKKELDDNMRLLKWVFHESDTIPLFKDVPDDSHYRPIVISETYTAGVRVLDSLLMGYFYTVTPSRTADLKVYFPVDSASITLRDLPLIKGLALSVTEQTFFLLFYSESKVDEKFPVTIAKITRVSGLEWSKVISTMFRPVELKFTSTSGELSIKTMSTDGSSKMVVIDKTGNRLQ